MGVWGEHNFENDDAIDWVYELVEIDDVSIIANALDTAIKPSVKDYVDYSTCAKALAASEVLAAFWGKPCLDMPIEINRWISEHRNLKLEEFLPTAREAIKRIRSNSEMRDLWNETDDLSIWYQVINDLSERLVINR